MTSDPQELAYRWVSVMSDHDLEAAVNCFSEDYHDVTPTRPGQDFRGRERVRANFAALFADVPDLRAEILRSVVDDEVIWMEWRMYGTRTDGTTFEFAGVNLFGVDANQFTWGRIYTHLVQEAGDIAAQVERMTHGHLPE